MGMDKNRGQVKGEVNRSGNKRYVLKTHRDRDENIER